MSAKESSKSAKESSSEDHGFESGNEPTNIEHNLKSAFPSEVYQTREEDSGFAAPLHLHAIRSPCRLVGSSSGNSSRSGSRSSSVSRSRSTSPKPIPALTANAFNTISEDEEQGSSVAATGGSISESSANSLDGSLPGSGMINEDILTDRLGMVELEPPPPHVVAGGTLASPQFILTSVNERMSEESLDDVHAFSDALKRHSGSARSVTSDNPDSSCNNSILATLDEEENFEFDDEEDETIRKDAKKVQKKKIKGLHTIEDEASTNIMFEMLEIVSSPGK
mmetsp:Transcript_2504/g.3784  ORF Transcript_2504/g.3784 Transcript_2504/m.3784 type:complete len:280 (+) Transcript_2504:236-1075(+)|eukprot:CAMPEP_0195526536 /NCGR_PEP_ID=MMETSP0794_2-20130614/27665_1 /TAXON_ID=515487 /ORGANISM="Stephanopyxis turris, Strain CCMP 815" /LENGTH=279 /DNA_ID=CAMNT_0040657251 /DNA_START=219 /DNA_END=1058 /DNA_ORIENTATION=+